MYLCIAVGHVGGPSVGFSTTSHYLACGLLLPLSLLIPNAARHEPLTDQGHEPTFPFISTSSSSSDWPTYFGSSLVYSRDQFSIVIACWICCIVASPLRCLFNCIVPLRISIASLHSGTSCGSHTKTKVSGRPLFMPYPLLRAIPAFQKNRGAWLFRGDAGTFQAGHPPATSRAVPSPPGPT